MSNYKTLQRRLAHLERRAGINAHPRVWSIRVNFVGVNDPKPWEPTRAEAYGRVWRREPGETGEDFGSRVTADARNHDPPLTSIHCYYDKEHDPNFNQGTSSSGSDA
jgi:hypothetical protein